MKERDALDNVLSEWRCPEPSPEFDDRVLQAYRRAGEPFWHRFWRMKVSIPAPLLVLAAAVIFALVLCFRPSPRSPVSHEVSTQFDSAGFQPLPHGEARVISVKDLYK